MTASSLNHCLEIGDHYTVELALESGPPSGRVSVEHVINVLGRLNAAPVPENVATILQVSTPPLANTARYDRLRAQADSEEIDHA